MPLSDREQQLLEQMERALIEEDPRFATSMRGGPRQARNRRRLAIGIGGVIVGLGVILLGVTTQLIVVGGLGFALMVGAVVYAMTDKKPALHAVPAQGAPARAAKSRKPKGSSSFMSKMEQRWEQRRDEGRF
jgi:hypothetical protein